MSDELMTDYYDWRTSYSFVRIRHIMNERRAYSNLLDGPTMTAVRCGHRRRQNDINSINAYADEAEPMMTMRKCGTGAHCLKPNKWKHMLSAQCWKLIVICMWRQRTTDVCFLCFIWRFCEQEEYRLVNLDWFSDRCSANQKAPDIAVDEGESRSHFIDTKSSSFSYFSAKKKQLFTGTMHRDP